MRMLGAICCLILWSLPGRIPAAHAAAPEDAYDVVWETPSRDFSGSMPLGNGDIGLNAWVEENGDLVFYISKTDSWGDNGRLLKVGRVRIHLDPATLPSASAFRQQLSLRDATMNVRCGEGETAAALRLWVDANHPMIHVTVDSARPRVATASIELWRTGQEELPSLECSDVLNQSKSGQKTIVEPDTVLANQTGRIGWYHHNVKSVGPAITGEIQGLKGFERPDPLLDRTFGAVIQAAGGQRLDDLHLESPAATHHAFSITVATRHPSTPEQWLKAVDETSAATQKIPFARRRDAHERWWRDFWDRSWIHVTTSGPPRASSLIPSNALPVRVGVDQAGGNRLAGEIGRLTVFGRPLDAGTIRELSGLDRRKAADAPPGRKHPPHWRARRTGTLPRASRSRRGSNPASCPGTARASWTKSRRAASTACSWTPGPATASA